MSAETVSWLALAAFALSEALSWTRWFWERRGSVRSSSVDRLTISVGVDAKGAHEELRSLESHIATTVKAMREVDKLPAELRRRS